MRRRAIKRRRLLAGAGIGGAALALRLATGQPPVAQAQAPAAEGVTPELLGQLAGYANFPLSPERAAQLAPLLAGPLAAVRALRPAGYDNLEPAVIFRVPPRH